MISSQKPCNLGKNNLSISITVGILGLLISCIFTCLFYSSTENQKKTLNFLTTILGTSAGVTSALYIGLEIIDEKTTYQFYRSIVQAYCNTFNLWIIKLRNDKENPTLFKSFTDLSEKWKNGN